MINYRQEKNMEKCNVVEDNTFNELTVNVQKKDCLLEYMKRSVICVHAKYICKSFHPEY